MSQVVTLCPGCTNCPTVEVGENKVRIGEGDNRVTLTPEEWNVLVRAIKAGELDEVK